MFIPHDYVVVAPRLSPGTGPILFGPFDTLDEAEAYARDHVVDGTVAPIFPHIETTADRLVAREDFGRGAGVRIIVTQNLARQYRIDQVEAGKRIDDALARRDQA